MSNRNETNVDDLERRGAGGDEENVSVGSTQPVSGEDASSAEAVSVSSSGPSASNKKDAGDGGDGPRKRRPFVSRHRRALDYIRTDSIVSRRHQVPNPPQGPTSETDDLLEQNQEHAQSSVNGNRNQRRVSQSMDSILMQSTIIKNQFRKYANKQMETFSNKKPSDWLDTFLPMCKWLRQYDWKTTFAKDLIAGLTVGVMIVPQSMSYAKLAGLPVEYGLYSALMPVFAYSFFGTSRQLAVGPVALISLLLSTGIDTILSSRGVDENDPSYETIYATIAVQISFLVGITNIAMGLLQLGFVTIFLSHAVISGTYIYWVFLF